MKFSERYGFEDPAILRLDSVTEGMRNLVWQALYIDIKQLYHLEEQYGLRGYIKSRFFDKLVVEFFRTTTEYFDDSEFHRNEHMLKKLYDNLKWHQIYDFIEFFFEYHEKNEVKKSMDQIRKNVNFYLSLEKSAYRIFGSILIQLTNEAELAELSRSLKIKDKFSGARAHIEQAARCHSQRPSPDYRNTIKEAISAVESACKVITGDDSATLGSALKKIEKNQNLHPAMKKAFAELYGYTSDSGGIRHAMLESETVSEHDARFMLIACSAFLNRLVAFEIG